MIGGENREGTFMESEKKTNGDQAAELSGEDLKRVSGGLAKPFGDVDWQKYELTSDLRKYLDKGAGINGSQEKAE